MRLAAQSVSRSGLLLREGVGARNRRSATSALNASALNEPGSQRARRKRSLHQATGRPPVTNAAVYPACCADSATLDVARPYGYASRSTACTGRGGQLLATCAHRDLELGTLEHAEKRVVQCMKPDRHSRSGKRSDVCRSQLRLVRGWQTVRYVVSLRRPLEGHREVRGSARIQSKCA